MVDWDFAAQERLEALHVAHLPRVMALLDKPLRTLEALRDWASAVAALQMELQGKDLVTIAAPPPKVVNHGQHTPASCARGVHSFGPYNEQLHYAECGGCGTRVIVDPANRGGYNEVATPRGWEMP